jgi:hypothetical protein
MDFETPVTVANPYLGSGNYKAAFKAANATPAYCSSADYLYNYGGGWNYAADGCRATAGAYSELFQKSPGRASFVSFYQEFQLEHSGVGLALTLGGLPEGCTHSQASDWSLHGPYWMSSVEPCFDAQ